MARVWLVALALACVFASAAAQVCFKTGVSERALQADLSAGNSTAFLVQAIFSPWVISGLALYVASVVAWLIVLGKADVSWAYPFVSLGFAFTAFYGYFVLHEPMMPARIAGIALIMGGVWLVARS